MKLEIHIVQNFSPNCLNRDDTNSPKECMFGGVRRARISSQAFKRAIRTHSIFQERVDGVGIRSKQLTHKICDLVLKLKGEEEPDEETHKEVFDRVVKALKAAGYKLDDKKHTLKTLLFVSPGELDQYAKIIHEHYDQVDSGEAKKALKAFSSKTEAADIALFGRMVTDNTNMNIDAACQVAQAISTHEVRPDLDFFTAVDDLNTQEETGAGMMGIIEFNSACYYRYSLIDINQLITNLHGGEEGIHKVVEAFLRASVAAIPSGKQSTMAAYNPPSMIMLRAIDGGMPWSLSNAFASPVRVNATHNDLPLVSAERLLSYDESLKSIYGDSHIKFNGVVSTHENIGEGDLNSLINGALSALRDQS